MVTQKQKPIEHCNSFNKSKSDKEMTNQNYDRIVNADVKNEVYKKVPIEQELRGREIQAMETIAESLRSIAISFSTVVTMIEEDFKEEQSYRRVNERLKF